MSLYQNQGATCPKCIWQEPALKGDITAKYQCKKCMGRDGRKGFDPKPGVNVEHVNAVGRNGRLIMVRKVID